MFKQCSYTELVKVDSTVVQVVFRIKEAGILSKQSKSHWKTRKNDNSLCWFTREVASEILELMKTILVERVEASEKRKQKQKSRFQQNLPPPPKPKGKTHVILKGPNVTFTYTFVKQLSHQHVIHPKSGKSSGYSGRHRSLPMFEEKVIIYAQPRTDSVYLQSKVKKNPVSLPKNTDTANESSSSSYFGVCGDGKTQPVEVDKQLSSLKNLVKKNKKHCLKKKLKKKEITECYNSSMSGVFDRDLIKCSDESRSSFRTESPFSLNGSDSLSQTDDSLQNTYEKPAARDKTSQGKNQQVLKEAHKIVTKRKSGQITASESGTHFAKESSDDEIMRVIKRKRMLSSQSKKNTTEATDSSRRLSTPKSIELEMTRMGEILLKAAACATREKTGCLSSESDLDIELSPPRLQEISDFDEDKGKDRSCDSDSDTSTKSSIGKATTTNKKKVSSPLKMMVALASVSEESSSSKEEVEKDCIPEEKEQAKNSNKEMNNNIKALRNITDLEEEHIAFMVVSMETYLKNIFEGKVKCRRHEDYKKAGKSRVNLNHQVPLGIYSEAQYDFVVEQLVKIFCKRHFKYVDYILKVMLPETLIKMYMEFNNIDDQDMAEKMMNEAIMNQESTE